VFLNSYNTLDMSVTLPGYRDQQIQSVNQWWDWTFEEPTEMAGQAT